MTLDRRTFLLGACAACAAAALPFRPAPAPASVRIAGEAPVLRAVRLTGDAVFVPARAAV